MKLLLNDINTVTKHVTDWKSTKTEIWKLNFYLLSFSDGLSWQLEEGHFTSWVCSIRAPLGPKSSTSSLPYDLLWFRRRGVRATGTWSWNQLTHDVSSKLILCPGKSSQDLWKLANNICITRVSCQQPSESWIWWTNCYILEGTGFFFVRIFLKKDSLHLISVLVYIHPFLKLKSL